MVGFTEPRGSGKWQVTNRRTEHWNAWEWLISAQDNSREGGDSDGQKELEAQ